MRRLCFTVLGFASAFVATAAYADSKAIRQHLAPTTSVPRSPPTSDFASNSFFDPDAPSIRSQKSAQAQFPPIRSHTPVEPQGGFSIRAGRDNPGEPMTGGLKFRF